MLMITQYTANGIHFVAKYIQFGPYVNVVAILLTLMIASPERCGLVETLFSNSALAEDIVNELFKISVRVSDI